MASIVVPRYSHQAIFENDLNGGTTTPKYVATEGSEKLRKPEKVKKRNSKKKLRNIDLLKLNAFFPLLSFTKKQYEKHTCKLLAFLLSHV